MRQDVMLLGTLDAAHLQKQPTDLGACLASRRAAHTKGPAQALDRPRQHGPGAVHHPAAGVAARRARSGPKVSRARTFLWSCPEPPAGPAAPRPRGPAAARLRGCARLLRGCLGIG